jgi:hypothetical protein
MEWVFRFSWTQTNHQACRGLLSYVHNQIAHGKYGLILFYIVVWKIIMLVL